jgi:hypothetical protein
LVQILLWESKKCNTFLSAWAILKFLLVFYYYIKFFKTYLLETHCFRNSDAPDNWIKRMAELRYWITNFYWILPNIIQIPSR